MSFYTARVSESHALDLFIARFITLTEIKKHLSNELFNYYLEFQTKIRIVELKHRLDHESAGDRCDLCGKLFYLSALLYNCARPISIRDLHYDRSCGLQFPKRSWTPDHIHFDFNTFEQTLRLFEVI